MQNSACIIPQRNPGVPSLNSDGILYLYCSWRFNYSEGRGWKSYEGV
jgi:hypothetical protein